MDGAFLVLMIEFAGRVNGAGRIRGNRITSENFEKRQKVHAPQLRQRG
jgi:hypothetical protein